MSNVVKTTLLLALLSGTFLFIGEAVGGGPGLLIGLAFAVVSNFAAYWFSDKVVLRMYRAREVRVDSSQIVGADHRLYRTVATLAARAGLPMPRVYVIPDASPNAFATGRNPEHAAVAATEGILGLLNDDELEGVIAHELAHVRHRDILISSIAATLAAAIMFASRFAFFFGGSSRNDREGMNPIAAIATLILAPLAATLIQLAISRSREFDADRGGADMAGSPYGLASALRKLEAGAKAVPLDASPSTAHMFIVKPFSGRGLSSLFSTHPSTEDRIAALLGQARQ
jgi:heat shock protein HtpX